MEEQISSEIQNALQGEEDKDQMAQALSELIKQLGDDRESVISLFTELTQREIRHLSVLAIQSDTVTKDFVKSYEKHKVSHMRRGRGELIDIANAMGSMQDDEPDTLRDKLLSRFR